MVKKTVLKVDVSCEKCKKKLMQAVSRLQGVDKIEIDSAKSTLTVTGDVDPVEVTVRSRKAGKFAEVVSIGPPPPPPPKPEAPKKAEEKKPEEKKAQEKQPELPMPFVHIPELCPVCQQIGVPDPNPSCSIM